MPLFFFLLSTLATFNNCTNFELIELNDGQRSFQVDSKKRRVNAYRTASTTKGSNYTWGPINWRGQGVRPRTQWTIRGITIVQLERLPFTIQMVMWLTSNQIKYIAINVSETSDRPNIMEYKFVAVKSRQATAKLVNKEGWAGSHFNIILESLLL